MKLIIHKSNCRSISDLKESFGVDYKKKYEWAVVQLEKEDVENKTDLDDCLWLWTFPTRKQAVAYKKSVK